MKESRLCVSTILHLLLWLSIIQIDEDGKRTGLTRHDMDTDVTDVGIGRTDVDVNSLEQIVKIETDHKMCTRIHTASGLFKTTMVSEV